MTLISLPLILFADYFLSYNAEVYNSSLISSHLECSKALTLSNEKGKFLFELNVEDDNPLRICQKYKNTIIDRLLTYQTVVSAQYNKNDRVKIVFLPHRFDIIIKNGTAYFYIKGDN